MKKISRQDKVGAIAYALLTEQLQILKILDDGYKVKENLTDFENDLHKLWKEWRSWMQSSFIGVSKDFADDMIEEINKKLPEEEDNNLNRVMYPLLIVKRLRLKGLKLKNFNRVMWAIDEMLKYDFMAISTDMTDYHFRNTINKATAVARICNNELAFDNKVVDAMPLSKRLKL